MTNNDLCVSLHQGLSSLYTCVRRPRGDVKIRTPMLFPDGGVIDVFVVEQNGGYVVTDYGDGLGWLRTQSRSGKLSTRQRDLMLDACATLDVGFSSGQLVVECSHGAELADAVNRLAQAVVRVADIWFTFRTKTGHSVANEVETWLRARDFKVARSQMHTGVSGKRWNVDFTVVWDQQPSIVFLMSTASHAYARQLCNHVVAGSRDLRNLVLFGARANRVALVDDSVAVWRPEDIALIGDSAYPALWSGRDELEYLLTAPDPVVRLPDLAR